MHIQSNYCGGFFFTVYFVILKVLIKHAITNIFLGWLFWVFFLFYENGNVAHIEKDTNINEFDYFGQNVHPLMQLIITKNKVNNTYWYYFKILKYFLIGGKRELTIANRNSIEYEQ